MVLDGKSCRSRRGVTQHNVPSQGWYEDFAPKNEVRAIFDQPFIDVMPCRQGDRAAPVALPARLATKSLVATFQQVSESSTEFGYGWQVIWSIIINNCNYQ